MGSMTERERVWRALQRNPGATTVALAKLVSKPRNLVTRILWGLRNEKFVDRVKVGKIGYWRTKSHKPPIDLSGCNPKSLANLNSDYDTAVDRMKLAWAARGITPKPKEQKPVPVDACALAQFWTSS